MGNEPDYVIVFYDWRNNPQESERLNKENQNDGKIPYDRRKGSQFFVVIQAAEERSAPICYGNMNNLIQSEQINKQDGRKNSKIHAECLQLDASVRKKED